MDTASDDSVSGDHRSRRAAMKEALLCALCAVTDVGRA